MTAVDFEVDLKVEGPLATLTLHRPGQRNAMTVSMWQALGEKLDQIAARPPAAMLAIRGRGGAFTTGSDVREFAQMDLAAAEHAFVVMEDVLTKVERLPLPTVAVVDGFALGAGCELARAADMRLATSSAVMGMPIARLGIRISTHFARRLVDLLGPSRAKELLYTGRLVDAQEAASLGLINRLIDREEIDGELQVMAQAMNQLSPASLLAAKRAVGRCVGIEVPVPPSMTDEFVDAADFPEGVRAFVEKRKPQFRRNLG
jgi:enoyl-CoA hydratase